MRRLYVRLYAWMSYRLFWMHAGTGSRARRSSRRAGVIVGQLAAGVGSTAPASWKRWARSLASRRSVRARASRTCSETWIARACSSQVYQVTPTAESCATSSRRRPGVRRRRPRGRPTCSGVMRSRRLRRKTASSWRRTSEPRPPGRRRAVVSWAVAMLVVVTVPLSLHPDPVSRYFCYQDKDTLVPPSGEADAGRCDRHKHLTHRLCPFAGRVTRTRRARTVHRAARRGAPPHRLLHRQRRPAHHRPGSLGERGRPRTGGRRVRRLVRRSPRPRRAARRPLRPAPALPRRDGGLRRHLTGLRSGADRLDPGGGPDRTGRGLGGDAAAGARDDPVGDGGPAPREGDEPVRRDGGPVDGGGPDPRRRTRGRRHRGHRLALGVPGERAGGAPRPDPGRPDGAGDPLAAPGAGGRAPGRSSWRSP